MTLWEGREISRLDGLGAARNERMLYHITLRIVHSSLFVSLCERTYLPYVVKEKYTSCMREDLLYCIMYE